MSVKKFGAFAANPGKKKATKKRKAGKAAAPKRRKRKATASKQPAAPKRRRVKRKTTARKTTARKTTARKSPARKSRVRSLALYSASKKKGKKAHYKRVGSVRVKSNAGEKIDWGRLAIDAGIGGASALFVSYAAQKLLEAKGGAGFAGDDKSDNGQKRAGVAGLIAGGVGAGIAFLGHKKHNKMAKRVGLAMAFVGGGLAVQGFAGSKLKEWAGQLPGIKGLGGVYAQPTMQGMHGMTLMGVDNNVGGMYSSGNDTQAVMAGTSPFTQTQFG